MKNNYEDILNRFNTIINAIPLLKNENNEQKIKNLIKEVSLYKSYIEETIKKLVKSTLPILPNAKIDELENQLDILLECRKLYYMSKNFYGELGINKIFYEIDNPDTLEKFNNNILKLLNILNELKINVEYNDFNYTEYVTKYMNTLIENELSEDFKQIMKNSFDGIYWEENSILENISINIKKIFYQNEKKINENILIKLNNFINEHNINQEDIFNNIKKLQKEINDLKEIDQFYVKDLFLIKKENPENYNENSELIQNTISFFNFNYNNYDLETKKQFIENIYFLKYDLDEYNKYMKYKFLIDETKDIIVNEQKNSNIFLQILDELDKTTKKHELLLNQNIKNNIIKEKLLMKKTSAFFNESKKISKVSKIDIEIKNNKIEIDKLSKKIKSLQKDKEKFGFEEYLINNINNETTLYDILKLYQENNIILYDFIINNNKELKNDDLEKSIDELKNFLLDSNIQIINNIKYNNSNDIKTIIEKKYKLLNIDINLSNIDEIIKNVNILYNYRNIKLSKINLYYISQYIKYYL